MTRRNAPTLGDHIIEELGRFAVSELDLADEVNSVVTSYFDGVTTKKQTIVAIWELIQQNDPDPEPRCGDYIGDPQLASLASAIVEGNEDGE